MIVNAVHLEHRHDRKASIEKEAQEQGFKINFIEGIIDKKSPCRGVTLAHKIPIGCAKNQGKKMVCVAEDDIKFFAAGAWNYFLKNIPKDFDMYFGMIYSGTIDENNRITEGYSGNTIYIVHERFYDYFLGIPDNVHLDRFLGESCDRHKYIVCNPFIAYQDGSYSDRTKSRCDYTPLLEGRKLFGVNSP